MPNERILDKLISLMEGRHFALLSDKCLPYICLDKVPPESRRFLFEEDGCYRKALFLFSLYNPPVWESFALDELLDDGDDGMLDEIFNFKNPFDKDWAEEDFERCEQKTIALQSVNLDIERNTHRLSSWKLIFLSIE